MDFRDITMFCFPSTRPISFGAAPIGNRPGKYASSPVIRNLLYPSNQYFNKFLLTHKGMPLKDIYTRPRLRSDIWTSFTEILWHHFVFHTKNLWPFCIWLQYHVPLTLSVPPGIWPDVSRSEPSVRMVCVVVITSNKSDGIRPRNVCECQNVLK